MSNIPFATAGASHPGGQSTWYSSCISAGKLVNGFDNLTSRVATWVVGACNTVKNLRSSLLLRIRFLLGLNPVFHQPESAPLAAPTPPTLEQARAVFAESRARAQAARAQAIIERLVEARPRTLAEAMAQALAEARPRAQVELPLSRQHFQIDGLSERELLSLSVEDVQSIHHDALFKLPQSTQDNLGFGRMNKLSIEEAGNLISDNLNSLGPISIYGIVSNIIDALSEECIKGLNASVFNHLNLMTIASIDTSILRKISPTTLKGLKSRFLNALPLDPSDLPDDTKRHFSARAVRWSGQSLDDILTRTILNKVRSGQRLYWVDA